MSWLEMDFTKMVGIASGSFHFVLDKGAMDALVAHSGDPWNPSKDTVEAARQMMGEVARVLVSPSLPCCHILYYTIYYYEYIYYILVYICTVASTPTELPPSNTHTHAHTHTHTHRRQEGSSSK